LKILFAKALIKDLEAVSRNPGVKKRLLKLIETLRAIDTLDELHQIRKIEGCDLLLSVQDWRLPPGAEAFRKYSLIDPLLAPQRHLQTFSLNGQLIGVSPPLRTQKARRSTLQRSCRADPLKAIIKTRYRIFYKCLKRESVPQLPSPNFAPK
jgi:hypothetical protein